MLRAFIILGTFIFALFLLPTFRLITQSQSINLTEKEVIYQLPYSGLLPDHPLYPLKQLRDTLLVITTRDNVKKAQLYLNLSNRMFSESLGLAQKGKEGRSLEHMQKAQEEFFHIMPAIQNVKKQGGAYPDDFVDELYLSNAKHREVMTEMMKKTTNTNIQEVEYMLKRNDEAKQLIDTLP